MAVATEHPGVFGEYEVKLGEETTVLMVYLCPDPFSRDTETWAIAVPWAGSMYKIGAFVHVPAANPEKRRLTIKDMDIGRYTPHVQHLFGMIQKGTPPRKVFEP